MPVGLLKSVSKHAPKLLNKSQKATKQYIIRFSSSSSTRSNWLEENCGDVPRVPRPQNEEISEMLRGGHAIQIAHSRLLKGNISGIIDEKNQQKQTFKELSEKEEEAIEKLKEMVLKKDFRFRPSVFVPFMYCSSQLMGQMVSFLGEKASETFVLGMKQAIADYYNDQIRELYTPEFTQKHTQEEIDSLKELFKQLRDQELTFVDTKIPSNTVQYQMPTQESDHQESEQDQNLVLQVGKMSTKLLLQLVQRC